jgi:hypothetical protein
VVGIAAPVPVGPSQPHAPAAFRVASLILPDRVVSSARAPESPPPEI